MTLALRHRENTPQQAGGWGPLSELEQLQDRTVQLLENVWSGGGLSGALADPRIWTPLVDIEETDDAWIVEAEVPGVRRKDVNVEVRDSEVVISGEIKERERKGIIRRRTRRTGAFEYRVTLPGPTDADKVEAKVGDGVLTVRIPKSEQARPQRVEVTSGSSESDAAA
jgi:HSP20 family protein